MQCSETTVYETYHCNMYSVAHTIIAQYAERSMLVFILKIVHSCVHSQTDDESVLRIQCRLTLLTCDSDPCCDALIIQRETESEVFDTYHPSL